MTVGIYVRVSTQDQNTDLQHQELLAYCAKRGWTDIQVFADKGRTGTNVNRPAFKQLQAAAKSRKLDIILCWKLDRAFRSLKDMVNHLSEWEALNIKFVSLKDALDLTTPAGRALAQMLGVFAEFEASLIKERVKAGLANARARGKVLGRRKSIDRNKVRLLRGQDMSIRGIAETLKISTASVQTILKEIA